MNLPERQTTRDGYEMTVATTPTGWIKTVCDDCRRAWSAREIMIVSGTVRYSGRGGDGLAVSGVG
ncbi:hypothetical protein [Streptomyces sp. NPDC057199]|uniref:hypothetical protein n=1 Tax=Streptomyces sp. NPDC057199 TaxID=3346047 RepID=UPI0036342865